MDKKKKFLTKGPEYETVWANGPNCGINDLDVIARLDRLYDDIGLDAIEMGATLAVLMEAGHIEFGDSKGAIRLIREDVGKATPLGRVIGAGAAAYATSPMGADHTAGYSVTANVLGVGGNVDPLSPKGQVELSRNLQFATAAIDSAGLCLFVAFAVLDMPEAFSAIYQMINAQYGLKLGPDDVTALGETVLKIEMEFNRKAGFTAEDDRLPTFFETEKLPPHDTVFDVPHSELDSVFSF
jgi:aldehyde:ferredoxin oxidoreductase